MHLKFLYSLHQLDYQLPLASSHDILANKVGIKNKNATFLYAVTHLILCYLKKNVLHDYWFCLCTSIFSEISGWQFGLLYCAIFMVIPAIPFYLMLFIILSDFLTMQSLRDRYNEKDLFEVELTAPYVNEQDFDNYVREFVIDDAISECFAASEDSSPIFSFPVGADVFYSLLYDVIFCSLLKVVR